MRWQWIITEVGDKKYLAGCKLAAEKGHGDGGEFRDKPLGLPEYVTEDGQLIYEVIPNPDFDDSLAASEENPIYIYIDRPEELSEEKTLEITEDKRKRAVAKKVSVVDLVEAVIAMKNGDNSKVEELETLVNLEVESREIPDRTAGEEGEKYE